MRDVADLLTPILRQAGLAVEDLRSMSLAERVQASNRLRPKLHVALHSNAGGSRDGCGVYIHRSGTLSEVMAGPIHDAVAAITPTTDEGVIVYNHYETRETIPFAVIVEVDYHDKVTTAQWIRTHKRDLAVALATGILAALAKAYGGHYIHLAARPLIVDAAPGATPAVTIPAPTPQEDPMPTPADYAAAVWEHPVTIALPDGNEMTERAGVWLAWGNRHALAGAITSGTADPATIAAAVAARLEVTVKD